MTQRKAAIVTGAYGAIGKAIARQLAERGFEVTLVGRDAGKMNLAAAEIRNKTGNEFIRAGVADLSRKDDIAGFAARWQGPLHILINNAATGPRKRTETPEGIEVQWATNVLSYFWMINSFAGFMENQADARIVNVASYWAGGLDMGDPEFRRRVYDNDASYRASKQADRMITVAFAERLAGKGITVNSCHPGDVNSKLSNFFGFGGHETPDEGADTPVWLATDPSLRGDTGKYFEHRRQATCSFSGDKKAVERLFNLCSGY